MTGTARGGTNLLSLKGGGGCRLLPLTHKAIITKLEQCCYHPCQGNQQGTLNTLIEVFVVSLLGSRLRLFLEHVKHQLLAPPRLVFKLSQGYYF